MNRFVLLPAMLIATAVPASAQSICALVCPQTLIASKMCSLTIDQGTCSCTCSTVKLNPKEVPTGTKLQLDLNGTRYDLTKATSAGASQAFLDTLGDILTPEVANPKGEPGTVVLKDDGSIGGHYGDDGEFNPGKPSNMQ